MDNSPYLTLPKKSSLNFLGFLKQLVETGGVPIKGADSLPAH